MNSFEIDPNIILEAKEALLEIHQYFPEYTGRDGRTDTSYRPIILDLGDTPEETIKRISDCVLREPRIARYLAETIRLSYDYQGEGSPRVIAAGYGVVGAKGQVLDYYHTDPVTRRDIWKVAVNQGDINPSTRTLATPTNAIEAMQIEGFLGASADDPYAAYYQNPLSEEGQCTSIVGGQLHAEATLPIGAASLSVFTTYH